MSQTKPLEPLGPGDDLGPYRIHRQLRSPLGTELYQVGDRRNPEILLMRLEVFVPESFEVDFFTVRWDEIRLFTRFMHPRVLRLFEIGSEGRRHYAAMPWISARSLLACLEDDRGVPWPTDAALSVGRDIALGLGALHQWTLEGRSMQAVYKAVNAENLLISAKGEALLRPAPLAVPLLPNRVLTLDRLHHVSPEESRGLPLTPASDVASLGSVLYRLLSAIHPYRAPSRIESLKLAMEGRSTPLRSIRSDVPEPVAQLIHRMMAVDPSERPVDGAAAAHAIEDTAAELGIPLGAQVVRRSRRMMSLHWQ
jgi:serine/threonine protein kinase